MRVASLRTRLRTWLLVLSGGLLVAFAAAVALHSARVAGDALDQRLRLRNDALAAICEYEDGAFVWELTPANAAGLAGEAPRRTFVVQQVPDRSVLASSGEAAVAELAAGPATEAGSTFAAGALRAYERTHVYPTGRGNGTATVRIVTAEDPVPMQQEQRRLQATLAVGVLFALCASALAASLLARRIAGPLVRLADAAGRIDVGHVERMPRTGRGDEADRLASAFEQATDRLQEALARQTRFTADASHELRTPLAIVRTQADVALHRPRTPDEYQQVLREITHGVARMHDTLQSLLLLARADAGHLDYVEGDVDFATLAHGVFAARRAAAAAKGLELAFVARVPGGVRGDARLLAILLDNLITNAIRYSDRPGAVDVAVDRAGGAVVLAVVDRGIGIAPDRLPHIWERFFRADEARSRAAGGSGLGLSIVRAIAQRHDATCRAVSEPGVGTRIEVVFPPARARAPAAIGGAAAAAARQMP